MTHNQWQPNASLDTLKARASLMATLRAFFADRQVLEVETPLLSQGTVTDPHLDNFATRFVGPGAADGQQLYLQTSPEFAMKRLLAAGSGPIYQLGKAFRNEEVGRHHNPEFTLLEWYRPGFNRRQLMSEVDELLQISLNTKPAEVLSYQQVFLIHLDCDPLSATIDELQQLAREHNLADAAEDENHRDTLLQLLFSFVIEPQIGRQRPCMVELFPASQAALARLNSQDNRVAERFEVYYRGIELANGFHELTDADEQRRRFEQDNALRQQLGKSEQPIDERFLAALAQGLPDCSGVALGVDRLVMLALNARSLTEVISFEVGRA
ncbi:Lysine--tRNA ligase [Saliniradius amylolyticus]|uniref:Lysine--tRNA ligase n=1 Tax=Saliniradius amylolyticus TaxID=2183582 RepID=A0A2S2E6P8_9ALTE|nr:elongation factor P--(R)-beta-lysine ligase [Saliniradius amylolyticus]AWL13313.1 Lysine--tRNA ligase [Saliniradius amylolyticus]